MYNHYLLNTKPDIKTIVLYKDNDLEIEVDNIKSTENYLLKISVKGETLKNADRLDNIQGVVKEKHPDVITLASGSSKYYNQKLYPLINDMERKLRNLLYLANVMADKEYAGIIKDLEDKSMGDIFKLLFVDMNFMSYVRNIINKGERGIFNKNEFIKDDLLQIIEQKKETILWDEILYNKAAPTLKNNFQKVRKYRNAVMHAHNIDQKSYADANKLYKSINQELDDEISKIKISPVTEVNENISEMLSSTLASIDIAKAMVELTYDTQFRVIKEVASNILDFSSLKEIIEGMTPKNIEALFNLNVFKDFFAVNQSLKFVINNRPTLPSLNKSKSMSMNRNLDGKEDN